MNNQKSKMVGIISYNIHSSHMNYGAALHSFAFQVYLQRLGVNSVVVDTIHRIWKDIVSSIHFLTIYAFGE